LALDIRESLDENRGFIIINVILFVLLLGSIVEFTYVDITVHDNYSVQWGALCYTGNTNPDCKNIQSITNCPNGGDACIEAKYYAMLAEQAFYMSFILIFIKVSISHGVLRRKLNAVRIFQTVVWGITPLILLFSGFEDYLYYAVRGQPIPDTLPWLNQTGLFSPIQQYLTHDANATSMDLYIVMLIGFTAITVLMYFNTVITKMEDYKTPF